MNFNIFFWAASLLSAITFYVHTFIGGPVVVNPLLSNQSISQPSKWLNYYCWHNTTIIIAAMACAFIWLAVKHTGIELAIFATGLSLLFSLLSGIIAFQGKINPFRFPSTSLFFGIGLLGSLGTYGI